MTCAEFRGRFSFLDSAAGVGLEEIKIDSRSGGDFVVRPVSLRLTVYYVRYMCLSWL